ncbi:MAG: hypothetical protein IKC52_03095 [Clostridia bacterium]|nr:hypothetical protein [Clostridia bacterium]
MTKTHAKSRGESLQNKTNCSQHNVLCNTQQNLQALQQLKLAFVKKAHFAHTGVGFLHHWRLFAPHHGAKQRVESKAQRLCLFLPNLPPRGSIFAIFRVASFAKALPKVAVCNTP